MKYYSTERPIGPGTFPKYKDNKVLEVVNFDCKMYCVEVGRACWGYVEYEMAIPHNDAENYELLLEGI